MIFIIASYGLGPVLPIAADDKDARSAVIHFADRDGIRDWRSEGTTSILIQGTNGQWHRADFLAQCFDLPWSEKIAYQIHPNGSLDKFSSIQVGRERCHFKSQPFK